jgi:peptidyl-prolyl cis-trans isomerase D
MITLIRRMLETWPAKLFFMLLAGVFVIWGVGDVITKIGVQTWVAKVAGQTIELPQATEAYRRQMAEVQRMMGNTASPTTAIRRQVASQALQALVTRTGVVAAIQDDGITVPDAALRQAAFAMPAFKNQAGVFDKNLFLSVLRNNSYTEAGFLDLLRTELTQQQFMGALRAGTLSPAVLTREVYAFQHEKRVADTLSFPFAAAAAPPAPSDAELQRWYENHKDLYSTPERRRIKAIVLSPDTVAKDIQVTDDEIKAAYEARKADFQQPEKRSIEVVLLQDEAKAKTLAEAWRAGADWARVKELAAKDGGAPVELSDATAGEIPAPELAKVAFSAAKDEVPPPVHSALGWHVLKVTAITPAGDKTLEQVRPELKAQVLANKAADVIYDRANKIDDMLSAGTALDALPADLGVAAVSGTLDAEGNALNGEPAPIPGGDKLREALITAVFKAKPGDPARLIEAPHDANAVQSFFAFSLEEVIPPKPRPIAEVHDKVVADWTADARRHAQNVAATNAMEAIKAGQTIQAAAAIAGGTVQRLPPVGRSATAPGVPDELIGPLFTLKQGAPTMVETPTGFVVAVLAEVQKADPAADPVGYDQVADALAKSIGDDIENAVTLALRNRGNPEINQTLAATIVADQ